MLNITLKNAAYSFCPFFCVSISLFLLLALCCPSALADAPSAPNGWTVRSSGKNFVYTVYTPGDLQPGETYWVTVYPKASLSGLPLSDAMQRFCDKDAASLGTPRGMQGKVEVKAGEKAVAAASCQRTVVTAAKEMQTVLYFAVTLDGRAVEVARVVCSLKPGLIERYNAEMTAIVGFLPHALADHSASAPPAAGRLPFTPSELAAVGGPITPGKYVGDYVQNGKVLGQRTIYLYANGDYRLLNAGKEPDFNTGKVGYDPVNPTGMMMINHTFYDLFNDTGSPLETFCFYGHDAAGVPLIYGHRGYPSVIDQVLRYAGPPDRPSPTAIADRQAKADAAKREAERFKFVTLPSKGIQENQIAGLVMRFENGYYDPISNFDGSKRTWYLLLKNGSYHEGVPVAPCVIDAALSRRKEPEHWGTWKNSVKPGFVTLIPDTAPHHPVTFESIPMTAARPHDLQGRFERAMSTGGLLSGGSVTQWSVTFSAESRFQTSSSFSFSNGSVAQSDPLAPVMVYGGADDSGSYVFASGGGATVLHQNRRTPQSQKAGSDKAGTYDLRGYNLILHYDSGLTEYTPCYFDDAERKNLYFRGGLLFKLR